MVQVSSDLNALANLEDAFLATNSSDREVLVNSYTPAVLLPRDTATYFHYEGSLTTPPCTEGVNWIVMAEPKYVQPDELKFLRQHLTTEGKVLSFNWRPTQPVNDRTVYLNR
ncbi:unnamed protein product [Cylicostephanus goldi]|uniref:carbonic anhydrase n=1 Tax=Cylicostephanus goldi TaxID=71465 RepID=A0A3P6S336_CYLGO|nr:unnamed protein product [Cylicostephanus goldi]